MSIIFDRYEANLKDDIEKCRAYMQMGDIRSAQWIYENSVYPNLDLYKQALVREIQFGPKDIYYGVKDAKTFVIYLAFNRRL
jgi:hypothetical protein